MKCKAFLALARLNAKVAMAIGVAVAATTPAFAQLTTSQVTTITTAIDFGTILVGVAAAAAAIILVMIAVKGARFLMRMVG